MFLTPFPCYQLSYPLPWPFIPTLTTSWLELLQPSGINSWSPNKLLPIQHTEGQGMLMKKPDWAILPIATISQKEKNRDHFQTINWGGSSRALRSALRSQKRYLTVILWSLDFFPLTKNVSGFQSFGRSFQFRGSSVTPATLAWIVLPRIYFLTRHKTLVSNFGCRTLKLGDSDESLFIILG